MKVENDDLQKLNNLLQKYSTYHSKMLDIESQIEEIDKSRAELLVEVNSVKDAIEQTAIEEVIFKDYMISKYGSFDVHSILTGH